MEVQAYIRNVRVTPKKLRFFLPEIKKLTPQKAIDTLLYVEKKPAQILRKAIQSAVVNARLTLKVDDTALIFKSIAIEEGQKMKRYRPGGRGTVKPFARKFAHIRVILTAKAGKKKTEVQKALPEKAEKRAESKEQKGKLEVKPKKEKVKQKSQKK